MNSLILVLLVIHLISAVNQNLDHLTPLDSLRSLIKQILNNDKQMSIVKMKCMNYQIFKLYHDKGKIYCIH